MSEMMDEIRIYRGYQINYDPPPIPVRDMDWHYHHEQFDGGEDAKDDRYGHAASPEDCMREIDLIEDGHEAVIYAQMGWEFCEYNTKSWFDLTDADRHRLIDNARDMIEAQK